MIKRFIHRQLRRFERQTGCDVIAEADDIVQDAWLRWNGADTRDVASPRAFLAQTVCEPAPEGLAAQRRALCC